MPRSQQSNNRRRSRSPDQDSQIRQAYEREYGRLSSSRMNERDDYGYQGHNMSWGNNEEDIRHRDEDYYYERDHSPRLSRDRETPYHEDEYSRRQEWSGENYFEDGDVEDYGNRESGLHVRDQRDSRLERDYEPRGRHVSRASPATRRRRSPNSSRFHY